MANRFYRSGPPSQPPPKVSLATPVSDRRAGAVVNEPQWTADPIFNTPLVIGVSLIEFLVLGVCLWWAASAAFSRVNLPRRVVLGSLRTLIVLLLIFGMLRPTLVSTEIKKQPATLVVLLDRSRSMSVNDAFDGKTRWEALRATITEALPQLRDLPDFQVQVYTFDEDIQQLEFSGGKLDLDTAADGQMTAIGSKSGGDSPAQGKQAPGRRNLAQRWRTASLRAAQRLASRRRAALGRGRLPAVHRAFRSSLGHGTRSRCRSDQHARQPGCVCQK